MKCNQWFPGVILIVLGCVFVIKSYFPELFSGVGLDWDKAWPFIMIGVGVYLILKRRKKS